MPAITLGLFETAIISKHVRSQTLDVIGSNYIRTAKAKLAERKKKVEYRLNPVLYYSSTIPLHETRAVIRHQLENAGFIILDESLDNIEEV